MDRLESMSILLAVVDAGNLSAAARRLGTPLATVSRKVSELETHLGARLLNRSSRRIALTGLTDLNEVVVEAFLAGRIRWIGIADVLEAVLTRHDGAVADSPEAVMVADGRARAVAEAVLRERAEA